MSAPPKLPVEIEVLCDECGKVGIGSDQANPTPPTWLSVWGTGNNLGRYDFCSGACYDTWLAKQIDV